MECDQQKAENKKSSRSEQGKSLGKEFIRALNLLYSPEPTSADELRIMLEIEIAKQNKPRRPKLRTYPRRNKRRKINAVAVENGRSTVEKENNDISGQKTDAASDLDSGVVDDVGSRDDIPRISIPDEDQNDGAVCKVCNVPEFGLLTLTQCKICEKYYHPLCHQPPIVGLYFQEPNSYWYCGDCGKKNGS